LDQLGLKDKEYPAKAFKALISNAKNNLLGPDDINESECFSQIEQAFPKVYQHYQKALKDYNAVDFDDLLFLTVQLLREHPAVLEYYQERWKYLLIDEYQDTNQTQYTLVKYLVEKSNNLFVVGDPDQSIYSWRGANIKNILNFQTDYPGAQLVRLEQNYRSRSNILNAANALILNNESRYEKNLWSDLGEGEKICLYMAEDELAEAEFVSQQIMQHKNKLNVPLSQIAVFYRTNFQSRVFEDALLRKKIPYVIVGGVSFYQRREIKDILAFLRLIHSGSDFVAFVRTINMPKRGLGETTLEKIRLAAEEAGLSVIPFCEALVEGHIKTSFKPTAKQLAGLKDYIQIFQELRTLSVQFSLSKLVEETIRRTGYLDWLKATDKETYEDRKANLDELEAKADEWEKLTETPSLSGFLEELSLKSTLDEAVEGHERICLMTIHNSKGLEFQTAFLVGMEEDLFPHANSRESPEQLEEERRLCYVGMTRAKEYLYLTCAGMRYLWGTTRYMRPSRFLRELPREHIMQARSAYQLPFES
jgi:DNA helicase-2/ATP-dependent DNA helicase PcrA